MITMNEVKHSLYFPVNGVKIKDLYDWSNKKGNFNEETTSLNEKLQSKINEENITLFTGKRNVSAVDEKYSHQDQGDWLCQTSEKLKKAETAMVKCRIGRVVEINGEKLALFRHKEKVFAVNERCPHQGGPLHLGDVEELPDGELCVKCPWHNWCIQLDTGQVISPIMTTTSAKVYPVKTDKEGTISVAFQSINSKLFSSTEF